METNFNFMCFNCDFNCMKKGDFNRHLTTSKHTLNNSSESSSHLHNCIKVNHKCDNCNKTYKYHSGLWAHKKKCILIEKETIEPSEKQLIMLLIKENTEMKNLMMDVCKNNQSTTTIVNNNNNTINNKFNLQFFLNDTCKDALNLTDFVNSLQLQLEDLENVGSIGYVNGLSSIIIKNLNALEITKRPVHCSDYKREIMYVKEENKWGKEEKKEKKQLTRAIKKIANKNMKQITNWQKENPGHEYSDNKKNDVFLNILNESTGAVTEQENEEYISKIIKNISKEVMIDKI